MGQPLVIPVAHDFNCGWCWVGVFQAKRLAAEFGATFDWLAYELQPEELPWPDSAAVVAIPGKPSTPTRFQFQLMLHDMELPKVQRPKKMRTHNAHEAVEYVKSTGAKPDDFIEALYRAFWERGVNINDPEELRRLAKGHVQNIDEMARAIEEKRFEDKIVKFDAPSYKSGVFNVPTFWIGGERYAEQPYAVLAKALGAERWALGTGGQSIGTGDPNAEIYANLHFPPAPSDRPYTFINMVETIDGKILTGGRDEPVVDLGSKFDHQLMKRIEGAADAVLLGAQTLRAAKKSWNPGAEIRIVVTRSGNLDFDACFFTHKPIIATSGEVEAPTGVEVITFSDVDGLLRTLRERGIEKLLVLGGSDFNAQLFEKELVDEIFITVAPKIKLGKDVPTIADGNALPREKIQNYRIVEQHQVEDELFVRYRRKS